MTSSEKNTLFYLGLFGVVAFVGWKLWPSLRRAINSGSSGGGGGAVGTAGASNASPGYDPYENESASQGNLLSQLLNALSGGGSSKGGQIGTGGAMPNSIGPGAYSTTSPGLATALVNLITDGENASDQMAEDSDYAVSQVTSGDQISSVPYQLYDVNQNAVDMPSGDQISSVPYQLYDVNQNAVDMPQAPTEDLSDVDTNNYGTGQIDDGSDDSGGSGY